MASIFTRIIQGEIPCYKVAEDAQFIAFLDVNPVERGHVLVVPKQEIDYIFDLPEDLYLSLHAFARRVAIALRKAVPCVRIATAVIGLEVPHTHIHLIPLPEGKTFINFSAKRHVPSREEMQQIADDVAAAFV